MPVEFLTQAQKERHGRFIDEPSPEQLARHFHFDDADHALIARKRGAHNRLGFAIQLGTVRHLGTFLPNPVDVPRPVITYVGRQLDLDPSTSLLRYLERKQTRHAHCAEIRKVYGYHDFSDPVWRFRLSRWLYARTWLSNERPGHLFDLATHWLRQRKVLLPGATTLTRLISQIRERASMRTWQRLVVDKTGRVSQPAYTLCLLERLQDGLRRRDVYVPASDRWGDPRAKLLRGSGWRAKRPVVCRSLGHPMSSDAAVERLRIELDATYRRVADNFAGNSEVRVECKNGKSTLTLANLDKLDEPPSLSELRAQIAALIPRVDLAEILLEIQARTGFADEFTHISEAQARAGDLSTSICAVLLSEACNIGLRAVSHREDPALVPGRLHWVQQNYLRAETLSRANARLVDYQATLALANEMGGGEVASADGLRFVTPVRTLNAGPNRKYFGADRGITYYNFTSDQYTGFHGIVVPGTLRGRCRRGQGTSQIRVQMHAKDLMSGGNAEQLFRKMWLHG